VWLGVPSAFDSVIEGLDVQVKDAVADTEILSEATLASLSEGLAVQVRDAVADTDAVPET
jgi:hypothetical protein